MLICATCEHAYHLHITSSRVQVDDRDATNSFDRIHESYECTACKSTGTYTLEDGTETIAGGIESIPARPESSLEGTRGERA